MEQQAEGKLKQNISLAEAIAFCVAQVIGTGIFLKPVPVLQNAGSTAMATIIWLAAGLITMCTALTVAEVASYKPNIGGITGYITEYNGKTLGFLSGWFFAILNDPGTLAANSIATATFMTAIVPMTDWQVKLCAFAILWILGLSQMVSVKGTMKTQLVGAFIQAAPLVLVVILGLINSNATHPINFSLIGDPNSPGVALGLALLSAMWVYDGWQATANLGEEMAHPKRDFPRAILISLSFLTGLYMMFNVVGFLLMPAEEIIQTDNFGAAISTVLMGNSGRYLMTLLMIACSLFTMNAEVVQATRDILYQARNNNLPGSPWIRHIHPKTDTPINAIIFQGILSTLLMLTGTFESISLLIIFFTWVFTLIALFDVFKLRRQNKLLRSFDVPLFPFVPLVGIGGALFMLLSSIASDPGRFVIGIVIILLGLPVYAFCHKVLYKDK
ncbi:APC family permease [Aerococcus kribbianus]|uniref:Amino acid permease n=1 Tax=Aerococcus kribbianus TaxID=2999064 RepID=A0A9X3FMV1_9LACT|nr:MULTISPECIES: amino acid permease [unclassified Aerococcus]MCZ0717325.1 amino acid permease [Aerococcus sp. YH-aer221]MCZ0725613.1 amino acid permease [Aerococcus sp. YH-aer222]